MERGWRGGWDEEGRKSATGEEERNGGGEGGNEMVKLMFPTI